jgi:hypothetical protein
VEGSAHRHSVPPTHQASVVKHPAKPETPIATWNAAVDLVAVIEKVC